VVLPRRLLSRLCLAPLACLALAAGPARAAGEKEWQTSLRFGAATVNADGRKPWGFAGALDVEYGLTDAWALRASVVTSIHPVGANSAMDMRPTGNVRTNAALAGLTYTIDVLRLVPYADLQTGAVEFAGAVTNPTVHWAAGLGVGADYFWTRRWLTGVSFQYLFTPADLLSDPLNLGSSPFAFFFTLRGSRVFW
jgi:hypothetical protein